MAFLVDTNILVYRYDPRFPDKQSTARDLLRRGLAEDAVRIPHQALLEFVAVVTRVRAGSKPLLPAGRSSPRNRRVDGPVSRTLSKRRTGSHRVTGRRRLPTTMVRRSPVGLRGALRTGRDCLRGLRTWATVWECAGEESVSAGVMRHAPRFRMARNLGHKDNPASLIPSGELRVATLFKIRSGISWLPDKGVGIRLLNENCGFNRAAVIQAAKLGTVKDLGGYISERVKPWKGSIDRLFEGKIQFTVVLVKRESRHTWKMRPGEVVRRLVNGDTLLGCPRRRIRRCCLCRN